MAVPALMIGMMKCTFGGIECGSVKSASFTAKPILKEHKCGYPPTTDLRAVQATEGVFKVESEESSVWEVMVGIGTGLGKNMPVLIPFNGDAPGLAGVALTISGDGWGSGCVASGKQEDFGTCGGESTALNTSIGGAGTAGATTDIGGVPFAQPAFDSQALTTNTDNLLYGAPDCGGKCNNGSFNASGKAKYISLSWPPTLDAAILESAEISISAGYADGSGSLIGIATANMAPGSVPAVAAASYTMSTIGGTSKTVTIGKAVALPDISFSPGNDWNGLTVKATAQADVEGLLAGDWAGVF